MRRILIATLVISLVFVGQVLASRVTQIDLSYQNGATVAKINVDGPIRFTHQTEVPKDGRPDRVIVDILTATHDLGSKEYSNLPPCVISSIRSSQYAVSPEQIVRVVFDLTEAPIYRIDADLDVITIVFDYKSAKPFAAWSSSGPLSEPTPTVKPQAKAPTEKPVTVAQKNQEIEKDRQASLSPSTNPVTLKPAPTKAPESAAPRPEEQKPLMASQPAPVPQAGAHSDFGNFSEQRPRVAAKPAVKAEPTNSTPTVAQAPTPKAEFKPTTTVAQAPTPKAESKPTTTIAQAPTPKAESKPTTTSNKPEAVKSEQSTKSAPSKPARTEDKPAPSPVPKAPSKATLAAAPDKAAAKEDVNSQPSQKDEPKAAQQAPASDQPTTVASQPETKESKATNATSRFRRQAESAKIKGTMIAEFPQRLVVKYQSGGQRDPFASLVDENSHSNNPIETRVPNIEGLKLVGIIASDVQTNRALFEDNAGYSYMLKAGDKVRNGYVLRVEVDQVFFQIFEYGWSRTVALKMD